MFASPLVLVRHGVTDWNLADRYQGTTDTALNDDGRLQARRAGERIVSGLGDGVTAIVTSPLKRARDSAQIIADICGLSMHVDPRLRELSMGRWEGLNNLVVKERFYEERKSRKRDRWNFAPVGGESLAGRLSETREAFSGFASGTVIVAHAGTIRIAYHFLGGEPVEHAAARAIPHGEPLLFDGVKLAGL